MMGMYGRATSRTTVLGIADVLRVAHISGPCPSMRGTTATGSRSSSALGISAATSSARSAFDIAHATQPNSTNSTAPTATKAAAPGSAVNWNIIQPMTTVDGFVMVQATTISAATVR